MGKQYKKKSKEMLNDPKKMCKAGKNVNALYMYCNVHTVVLGSL